MAGVEQATAPGEATPGDTPKTEPRAGRRRASQKAGRQSDTPETGRTSAHARDDADTDATVEQPTEEPADTTAATADHTAAGAHADQTGAADTTAADQTAAADHADQTGAGAHAHQTTAADTTGADTTAATAATADETAAGAHADQTAAGHADQTGADTTAADHAVGTAAAPANGSARTVRAAGPAHADAPVYRPRHAKQRRRRWPILVAAGVVLVALAGAGAAALIDRQNDELDDITAPAATRVAPAPANLPAGDASGVPSGATSVPPPAATPGAGAPNAAPGSADCRFNVASDKTPRVVPPGKATRSGLVKVTIGTNRGPIAMELDATNAPCTVESFLTLASSGYFTDTACHRLTTMLIFVLQCGDPTATGSGDPGYSFDDENLPAPGGMPYPRGTLAMANAGPDTNGSQFFMVYKDSPIDPNYPVFGKVTSGLEIVDQVAAGGAPGKDGQPNQSLVIQAVQVS